MSDTLTVDTARLAGVGQALRALSLPSPPPPLNPTGTGAVAAALRDSLPVIDSPIAEALAVAGRNLHATAEKFVTAAQRYAETDELHGAALTDALRSTGDPSSGVPATGATLAAVAADAVSRDGETDDASERATAAPAADLVAGQAALGALTGVTTAATTLAAGVQGALGSAAAAPRPHSGGPDIAGPDPGENSDADGPDSDEQAAAGDGASSAAPLTERLVAAVGQQSPVTARSETR